jgi:hypothetical protein
MRIVQIAALALAVALGGCFGPQLRQDEAKDTANAAYAHCEELRQIGQLRNHEAVVQCAAKPVVDAYTEAGYPFIDLVYTEIEARRVGAQRLDNEDVTEAQYQQDVAVLDQRIAAEDKRRRDDMAFGGDAVPAPAAQLIAGLPSFEPATTAGAMRPATPNGCVPIAGIRACQ